MGYYEKTVSDLRNKADKNKALILSRFFKTGPGGYGEGDVFLGIQVPEIRQTAKKYLSISLGDIERLLLDKEHERRLAGVIMMVEKYSLGDNEKKDKIFKLYLKRTDRINNWDLVDLSVHHILGAHLYDRPRRRLYDLAVSDSLWERRMAMIACYYFIKRDDFADTLRIADKLMGDEHDLIHKAVGWMLRELGKRDMKAEENFLKSRYPTMPRTMLRYAIEKFPEKKRLAYLKGTL